MIIIKMNWNMDW